MLKGNKGPIIQVDRLIFDTRFKIKPSPVIPKPSPSPSLNKTNKEEINQESHIFIPSDKIKIIRLTLEDLNKDEKKIYSINQPSPSISLKTITQKDEDILSPIYESIDGRRDSFDLIKKDTQIERLC